MVNADERKEQDPFAEWNMRMPLIEDHADEAGFRIKNHPNGEKHRVHLTGYDRPGAMAVRGRLFHVVHGILGNGSSTPATLIVFEWLFVPGKLGRRFREVEIDVTFAPHGRRPGTMPDDDLSEYTPQVRAVAPDVPVKSYISGRGVTSEMTITGALRAGYEPFVAFTPEASRKKTETTERTDYRFAAGYPAFVNKMWGEPNSVHWTLQENAPQESGTPHLVRTAVLLQRTAGDGGSFSATIETSAHVSVLADAAEKLRKAVGSIPKDDPVYFDPRPIPGVAHGAAVLYGTRDGLSNQQSPCDKDNLGAVDLTQFLVVDDDEQWRVGQKGASNADDTQPATDVVEEVDLNFELSL
ncbi:hypothetical protein DL766_007924 [Monosporascus sp. MC13-8B]|uniref:Uncharacterized protein n=1 Tax=Monosporascus cannonballus TaxID=155416 RepID=A0ABY0H539_9PEZI|nr:hypothetical protein DL762_005383 [Monosporascus cannonballus]RYO93666.1 hypothetical protein DL763_004286 [Monosporascus cannonballus]RYP21451.1 hypothetical protein DL766_007924 [Monosporascus sp. MC13-8B]